MDINKFIYEKGIEINDTGDYFPEDVEEVRLIRMEGNAADE